MFDLESLCIVVVIIVILWVTVLKILFPKEDYICKDCGTVATPKKKIPGSALVELVLWLLFIIPGLIYTTWRVSTQYLICPTCKSKNVVPINSPIGKNLVSETKLHSKP
jgi:hypothetical protein